MKKLLTLVLLLLAGSVAAQDVLVLRDGTILNVKVTQVSDWEISYKKTEHLEGPVFSTDVSKVLSIKYENGTEQKFDDPAAASAAPVIYEQKANKGFSVYAGGAFPVGKFADDEEAFAKAGFNVGARYTFAIAPTNLGLFVSADFIYNNTKDVYFIDVLTENGFDVEKPKYYNVPVLVGLNYNSKVDRNLALWAELGVGANFRTSSKFDATFIEAPDLMYVNQKIDSAFSFAFQLGAGVTFNDKFSIGMNYYSLGSPKVNSTYESLFPSDYSGDIEYEKGTIKTEVPIGVFMLRLGYNF